MSLQPSGYYNKVATRAETAAWREAQRVNTAAAYRGFINRYPRSPYVPAASAKLSALVKKTNPPTLWNVIGEGGASRGNAGRSSGGGGGKSGY
jgi:hypothetical protein